jgi:hypothetical protein
VVLLYEIFLNSANSVVGVAVRSREVTGFHITVRTWLVLMRGVGTVTSGIILVGYVLNGLGLGDSNPRGCYGFCVLSHVTYTNFSSGGCLSHTKQRNGTFRQTDLIVVSLA